MISKPIMNLFDAGFALFWHPESGDTKQGFTGESFKQGLIFGRFRGW